MNNDALVAALGVDAVAAVRGYRLQVMSAAARRGLRLVSVSPSELVPASPDVCVVIDPIEIRLVVLCGDGRSALGGQMLTWCPAHGWGAYRWPAGPLIGYYADAGHRPVDLVPVPAQVVEWMLGGFPGPAIAAGDIDLDDDPEAIQRLLGFADPRYRAFLGEALVLTPDQLRTRLLHPSPPTQDGRIRSGPTADPGNAPEAPPT